MSRMTIHAANVRCTGVTMGREHWANGKQRRRLWSREVTRRVEWTGRLKRGINAGFFSLIALMALACTDENVSRGQVDGDSASQVGPRDHVYSIKVLVGSDDHRRLVEFLPGGSVRPSEGDEPSQFPVVGLASEA